MTFLVHEVADEAGTRRLAEDLAMILAPGDAVALEGDLGMGKSAFARALLRALADDPALEVPSPTFTLVQAYELPGLAVAHFDLYRLADPGELAEIGFDDALRRGAVLVEWPDRAGGALPAAALTVAISEGAGRDGRRFAFSGGGTWPTRIARSLALREMADARGGGPAVRRRMPGDASHRRLERVRTRAGERLVAMDWPRRPPQPPLRDGLAYPELVHVQDDPLSFAALAHVLDRAGFAAPVVRAMDREAGLLLVDDLGAGALVGPGGPDPARFTAAAEALAEKDLRDWPREVDVPGHGRWTIPPFDARALTVELSLLPDWYLPLLAGRPTPPEERAAFEAAWAPLVEAIGRLPAGLVLRDAIAANLVWRPEGEGLARVGFVDVQDAMIGPRAYDLASLVTDVRVDLPAGLAEEMVGAYAARTGEAADRAGLDSALALLSAQRNSKILGGFARLAVRDGKPAYLAHLPRVRRRVADALAHPVLRPLRVWYERHRIVD